MTMDLNKVDENPFGKSSENSNQADLNGNNNSNDQRSSGNNSASIITRRSSLDHAKALRRVPE